MTRLLSICVGHRDRSPVFDGDRTLPLFPCCVRALCEAAKAVRVPMELVVADWPTEDNQPVRTWLLEAATLPVRVVEPGVPFSRGAARNHAARAAQSDWLFFLDADMLTPASVLTRGCEVLAAGKAYFPLYRRYQGWNTPALSPGNGHGNCFVTRAAWLAAGGFPEKDEWGGEDTKFAQWFNARGLLVRDEQPDFLHQWHPK